MTRLLRSFVMHCAHSRQRGALLQLSRSLQRHGREALFRGRGELSKVIALNPATRYSNLGYLYIKEQKYAEAAAAVEKALQLNDKDYMVWGNLAFAYEGLKDKEKADKAHDREIALLKRGSEQPARRRGAVEPGSALRQEKLREQAISRIQSASLFRPMTPPCWKRSAKPTKTWEIGPGVAVHRKERTKGYALADLKTIPDCKPCCRIQSFGQC